MKVLPNTSSSGGTSFFGVFVWVIDNVSGLMPGNFAMAASSDCMLYCLRHDICAQEL